MVGIDSSGIVARSCDGRYWRYEFGRGVTHSLDMAADMIFPRGMSLMYIPRHKAAARSNSTHNHMIHCQDGR